MGRKIFSLTNKRVDFCQISSSVYIEGIFCKSSDQIYKPIEICNFVLWYVEDNNSADIYYDLAYPNKIAFKRIRSLKVKQVHFSFVENRQNTEHGVLGKAYLTWSWCILPVAGGFLYPKFQVCNLITYTACISIIPIKKYFWRLGWLTMTRWQLQWKTFLQRKQCTMLWIYNL